MQSQGLQVQQQKSGYGRRAKRRARTLGAAAMRLQDMLFLVRHIIAVSKDLGFTLGPFHQVGVGQGVQQGFLELGVRRIPDPQFLLFSNAFDAP